jgi:hypothetical protein
MTIKNKGNNKLKNELETITFFDISNSPIERTEKTITVSKEFEKTLTVINSVNNVLYKKELLNI